MFDKTSNWGVKTDWERKKCSQNIEEGKPQGHTVCYLVSTNVQQMRKLVSKLKKCGLRRVNGGKKNKLTSYTCKLALFLFSFCRIEGTFKEINLLIPQNDLQMTQ